MVKRDSVFIYNPSIKTGGTNNLLANLAILLANDGVFNIHYIDYEDSPARKIVQDNSKTVRYLTVSEERKPVISDGILVATILSLKTLKATLDINESTRILLWSTHPDDGLKILPSFNLWFRLPLKLSSSFSKMIHPFFKRRLREFIIEGMRRSGIVWMDDENINTNKVFYKLKELPLILPIFTGSPQFYAEPNSENYENNFKIVILGRFTNFKVFPYRGLFNQIGEYLRISNKTISIDFIGDGPFKYLVEKWLIEASIKNYRFLGHVDLSELDQRISDYQLLIGVATSTLEGAKLKIPSLLSNCSYDVLPPDKVKLRWMFDVEPFHVGRFVSKDDPEIDGKTFPEIMSDINSFERWEKNGIKCYDHWKAYHSPESLLNLVTTTINNNTFYFSKEQQRLIERDLQGIVIDKVKALMK